jgi:hypothetical protein
MNVAGVLEVKDVAEKSRTPGKPGVVRKRGAVKPTPFGAPGKPGAVGQHVRLRPDIVARARIIAAAEGTTISDLLSDLLEAPLSRRYLKHMRLFEQRGGVEPEAAEEP